MTELILLGSSSVALIDHFYGANEKHFGSTLSNCNGTHLVRYGLRSIINLLGRGHAPVCDGIGADVFHQYFEDKVAVVRELTSDAPPPSFSSVAPMASLPIFQPVSINDVVSAVRQLPDKYCASDPLPTYILKAIIADLAPFLSALFNKSLNTGIVPSAFKSAFVTPLQKKAGLNATDVKSYRHNYLQI